MRESIVKKAAESADLMRRFFEANAESLERCALRLASRFREGGRLWVMGNGGSACDAEHVAVEFRHPIVEKRAALPAIALGSSTAFTTAVGNDTDFSRIFVEELEMFACPPDMVLGISTSGASSNINRALKRGREMGLVTIAFSGRDGGPMIEHADFAFVVPSWSLHRTQETHTVMLHLLWDHVQIAMGEDDVL
jgi:D-sedoheptulose 7-phosphate isomerase